MGHFPIFFLQISNPPCFPGVGVVGVSDDKCITKMLYACRLWWNLLQTDIDDLERVNLLAAKRAQGLCATTKSEAALGSLGLWTVQGLIDKQKLVFLQKLICSPFSFVHKQLFVK